MAQDSRNVENHQERSGDAITSKAVPSAIRIDTSRIREREEQAPVAISNGDGGGGAQAGPNGNDNGGGNGQGPGLTQDSLSLQQLKKLVGDGGKTVVSLVWAFF